MTNTDSNNSPSHWDSLRERAIREGSMIGLLVIAVYLAVALLSHNPADPGLTYVGHEVLIRNMAGPSGAWVSNLLITLVGELAYLIPVLFVYRAWLFFKEWRVHREWSWMLFITRLFGSVLAFASSAALATLHFSSPNDASAGGYLGLWLSELLFEQFNLIGSTILLFSVLLFSLTLALHLSWLKIMEFVGGVTMLTVRKLLQLVRERKNQAEEQQQTRKIIEERKANLDISIERQSQRKPPEIKPHQSEFAETKVRRKTSQQSLFDPETLGQIPPLTLLTAADKSRKKGFSAESLQAMSRMLEIKLQEFGVDGEVVAVSPGPVVTRFEIQLAPGIKVSKISNVAKDLARSMAMVSVRVVEIIPGKTTVGIEIPNEDRAMVRLSEVLTAPAYQQAESVLTLGLGCDIGGNPVVADLAKMPHLLVAGTTGSGKSVGVNSMLISMLYKATPDQLRLILVDPKMLELSVYEGIPHLLTPVITDMKDAANGLRWCVAEMERRYKLMASVGVRNLAGFNKKVDDGRRNGSPVKDPLWIAAEHLDDETQPDLELLPVIVVVIDEFADMMMIVGKKVEELIARLAQKARAAGIHLILATQRPSVDVITGLIKANIPTRMAFQVSSKIDSRTILDQGGAQDLLGNGDMLYLPPGTSLPERVHGAFLSDDEVHAVVREWKKRGQPDYINEILEGVSDDSAPGMPSFDDDSGESDALFDEAVAFVTETRKVSISSVQRKLRIGYNRAARLVESMEAAGVVSTAGHNGSREVLAPPPV